MIMMPKKVHTDLDVTANSPISLTQGELVNNIKVATSNKEDKTSYTLTEII